MRATPLFASLLLGLGCSPKPVITPGTGPGTGSEICDDGLDNDGDSYADCNDLDCADVCDDDADDDGFDDVSAGGSDCDDSDPAINPEADEVCDGVDNDCDGQVDLDDPDLDPAGIPEWYPDADGDGYGAPGNSQASCEPIPGAADNGDDCDDGDPNTNPGAAEVVGDCTDNNCDGDLGETGCADTLYAVRTGDDVLVTLDLNTMVWTDVGPTGVTFDFGEVAWDSTRGVMWMVPGRADQSLYTVDVSTGAATLVGTHGIIDMFGLAVDPGTGTLYGTGASTGDGLYTLDPNTGAATLVASGIDVDGLDWDPVANALIGIEAGGGDLMHIDPATGATTLLINQGFVNNCGVAYDIQQSAVWAVDWSGDLYRYDVANGYLRTTEMSGLGGHDGLTFGP